MCYQHQRGVWKIIYVPRRVIFISVHFGIGLRARGCVRVLICTWLSGHPFAFVLVLCGTVLYLQEGRSHYIDTQTGLVHGFGDLCVYLDQSGTSDEL